MKIFFYFFSVFICLFIVVKLGAKIASFSPNQIKDGDIIFQSSKSNQSMAIQLATHSKYSHSGIIFQKNQHHYVLEAVQPVKWTTIEDWD